MKKIMLAVLVTVISALGINAQQVRKAPKFSLPDASGKMVSISDFKGKWVVLDFWGSWCGWCIKGFPQMKENRDALGDKVEFVGVAIGDSKEKWLQAIKQYGLTWTNLWENPDTDRSRSVASLYGVRGFPTKLIINPDGYIVHTTVGEDPEFYSILSVLVK